MFFWNKYDLKKPGDFTVSEGHGYPLIYIYIYGMCVYLSYLSELYLELESNCIIVVQFLDKITRLETFVFGKRL
jgi:hypothetical protein